MPAAPGGTRDLRGQGLTLAQASERRRLFRETFFVCRHCGKDGETIARAVVHDDYSLTFSVRNAWVWGWASAAVVIPLLAWMQWWGGVATVGTTLLAMPAIYWRENRKIARALAARGLPRPDAPAAFPVPWPAAGCSDETVIGRPMPSGVGTGRATGPCCERPDWIEAHRVRNEDRVPCSHCGHGTMVVSDHAIH
jgi:hypothetical protein